MSTNDRHLITRGADRTMEPGTTPSRRQCGAMSVHYRLLEMDPNFRQRQVDLEHLTARRMMPGQALRPGITTIPVVVHFFFNTRAENIFYTLTKRDALVST